MGVLSFLRAAKKPATPALAPTAKPSARGAPGARRSPDGSLERLEQEFGSVVAPAAAHLRAAVQWHRSGRKADAWAALESLLANPGPASSAQVRPAIESEIYSRMRICLEREGCFNPALTPAVLSYATRAKFFAVQGREAELLALRSPQYFDRYFLPLLERARVQHAMARFRMLVDDHLRAMPMIDLPALKDKVEAFRLNPPEPAKKV